MTGHVELLPASTDSRVEILLNKHDLSSQCRKNDDFVIDTTQGRLLVPT